MNPWECPRCGRVNAPWKDFCDCRPKAATQTSADATCSHSATCNHNFIAVFDNATNTQYACLKCGKIKLINKRGDTDGDH